MRLDPEVRQFVERLPSGLLVLRFENISEELRSFSDIVRHMLTQPSLTLLAELERELSALASGVAGQMRTWGTRGKELETLPSDGRHQMDREGHGHNLKGLISFTWDVEPIGGARTRLPLKRYFVLRNSSVRIRLFDERQRQVVSAWNVDVGDDRSPGCHFHAQIGEMMQGRGDQGGQRSLNLDIPRLPACLFMPTDAVEFVVCELWQREWPQLAASGTAEMNRWRKFPKARLSRLLKWQLGVVDRTTATPWVGFKKAKPDPLLLCDER